MSAIVRKQRGFTLVEILIVVIILGILAAIVIPQFTNASTDARRSNLKSQLQTLRSQIELYMLQHKDQPPNLIAGWTQLTAGTDINGNPGTDYGPYYQTPPANPLVATTLSQVVAADLSGGWTYNVTTGAVYGVDVDSNGNAIQFNESQ